MLGIWWVWVAFGLAVATLEVVVPGYVFVGFAIGAVLTGAAIGLGLPGGAWMAAAPLNAVVVFSILSLIAWLSLRYGLGVRRGQTKRIRHDINED